jgi:hypothetical protein
VVIAATSLHGRRLSAPRRGEHPADGLIADRRLERQEVAHRGTVEPLLSRQRRRDGRRLDTVSVKEHPLPASGSRRSAVPV